MESSNPTLSEKALSTAKMYGDGQTMTIQGTVNKALMAFAILLATAIWTWSKAGSPTILMIAMGGGIVGLIFALVTMFKKEWSAVTVPCYAACEGLLLGALSAMFEVKYPGIVMQAVGLTFGTLFSLLLAYKAGWIQATEGFKRGIMIATLAIGAFYLIVWVVSMFGIAPPAFINGGGLMGIGFSVFVVGIAALNLVLDFDRIENASKQSLNKYMEWYCAFGLMVTLVWLYMEILRLLSKVSRRD